jgi:putative solute:sodium symporter small subunit
MLLLRIQTAWGSKKAREWGRGGRQHCSDAPRLIGDAVGLRLEAASNRPLGGGNAVMAAGTPQAIEHWRRTRGLMITSLIIWFIFSFLIHLFAPALNNIVIIGFPLGFYMAAQGSLIIFVIQIFWFANKQNQIDEEAGLHEDE